ncbi:hypothetical protein M2368_001732 [Arthrobacter sp. JUb119]|uniref:hypothetical protein n=1 Tax=Micrococcaceae TaxID=1268 RepID=UPI0011B0BA00|nr:hypothetical protein [Arthrobacter sp. MYb214]MCS3492729.1 hypothetical protein [Arthrobacter sp. JUb119]
MFRLERAGFSCFVVPSPKGNDGRRFANLQDPVGSMETMRRVHFLAAALRAVALAISGCENFDAARTSNIGEECQSAIQKQNEAWSDHETPQIKISEAEKMALNACKNLDEWSTAVSYNPGSMGYPELSTENAANTVYLACASSDPGRQTPVCADAEKRGYLDAT